MWLLATVQLPFTKLCVVLQDCTAHLRGDGEGGREETSGEEDETGGSGGERGREREGEGGGGKREAQEDRCHHCGHGILGY